MLLDWFLGLAASTAPEAVIGALLVIAGFVMVNGGAWISEKLCGPIGRFISQQQQHHPTTGGHGHGHGHGSNREYREHSRLVTDDDDVSDPSRRVDASLYKPEETTNSPP